MQAEQSQCVYKQVCIPISVPLCLLNSPSVYRPILLSECLVEDDHHFIFHCNYYNPQKCDFYAHMTKFVLNVMDLTEDEKLHILCSKKMYKNSINKYMCNIYEM